MLYLSLEGGAEKQVGLLVQDLGWNEGKNLDLLVDVMHYLLGSANLADQFDMLCKVVRLEEHREKILYNAAEQGVVEVLNFYLEANPDLLKSDDSMGFDTGHVLAQTAMENGQVKMLQAVISNKDYRGSATDVKDTPHLLVLAEIAMEQQDFTLFRTLLPHLSEAKVEGVPL